MIPSETEKRLREEHRPVQVVSVFSPTSFTPTSGTYCVAAPCGRQWPCPTAQALALLDEERERVRLAVAGIEAFHKAPPCNDSNHDQRWCGTCETWRDALGAALTLLDEAEPREEPTPEQREANLKRLLAILEEREEQ